MTKEYERKGLDKTSLDLINDLPGELKTKARGLAGSPLAEGVPSFIKANGDKVIEGSNNASIVLTRDRPASRVSGYGGIGQKGCGTIDLVAGRLSAKAKGFDDGKKIWTDPNFVEDAARVYISQKTDVDDNFALAKGTIGNMKGKSAVALKADGIRFIGREGVKIITGGDAKNSQGDSVSYVQGIDLIAGNDDKGLQPMAMGINTRDALKACFDEIDKLNGIVDGLLDAQIEFNTALATHIHISPFFGLPTSPSPVLLTAGPKVLLTHFAQIKRSIFSQKYNIVNGKFKYTNTTSKKYVCSRYNSNN